MKKALVLLLCVMMVLSVFSGCAGEPETPETTGTPEKKEHTLKVGYGRVDVTPDYSVPLAGHHGDTTQRMSSPDAVDTLYVTCVALTDENDKTLLLYSLDTCYLYGAHLLSLRDVEKATGVPFDQVMLAATHNHSAPDPDAAHPSSEVHSKVVRSAMVDAAVAAMEDRKPAKMYKTTTYPEKCNYLRHYILNDGTKVGWTRYYKETKDFLFKADNTLQLVKFAREDARDVLLMNWQCHPMAAGANNSSQFFELRSDVDIYRKELEDELDCYLGYFLGASGDINSASYVMPERKTEGYTDNYIDRAKVLCSYVLDAADTFQEVKTGPLQHIRMNFKAKNISGANDMNIPVAAYTMGDLAFAAAPYEMFCKNGMAIRDGSPFEMTFVSTCTNGYCRYIPASYAFEYDCYELTMNEYEPGTAELLVEQYISMLNQLHGTRFGAEE